VLNPLRVQCNGARKDLGCYRNLDDAIKARRKHAKKEHMENVQVVEKRLKQLSGIKEN